MPLSLSLKIQTITLSIGTNKREGIHMRTWRACLAIAISAVLGLGFGAVFALSLSGNQISVFKNSLDNPTTLAEAQNLEWTCMTLASSSMENTLYVGETICGPSTGAKQNRNGYYYGGTADISVGDIVEFTTPNRGNSAIASAKRCVATAGQTVTIDLSGTLIIDGKKQIEPYANGGTYPMTSSEITYPYTVPAGCIFVLGDNRTNSEDSRYYGAIENSSVSMIAKKVLNRYTGQLEDINPS